MDTGQSVDQGLLYSCNRCLCFYIHRPSSMGLRRESEERRGLRVVLLLPGRIYSHTSIQVVLGFTHSQSKEMDVLITYSNIASHFLEGF